MTASVTINTLNEEWPNLSREVKAWQNQKGVDIQVIISTVEGDRNIDRLRVEFPTVDIAIMARCDHAGYSPKGSFQQLNNSLPLVKGEWWCFASGNDFIYPNKLSTEIKAATDQNKLVCYSDFNYVNELGRVRSRQRFKRYDWNAHIKQNIVPDCSLIHRSILDRFLPFKTKYNNYAYWDLWLRVRAELGDTFTHNPTPTWGYRQGSSDMHIKRMKSPEQIKEADADKARMLADHTLAPNCSVVNFCVEDHANFMFENSEALRSVGVNVRALKISRHPYDYAQQAEIATIAEIRAAISRADVVQLFFNVRAFEMVRPVLTNRHKVFMYYAGTEFRVNSKQYLRIMNPMVTRSVIALSEFAGLGAKNETYLSVTVDTDAILPSFTGGHKIGHYPSNPEVKGTETIRRVVPECHIDTTLLPYSDALARMAKCDIYIELFAPTNNGLPYGSFGTTAVEAAAMGKVVVTMNLRHDVYTNSYGDCPLILVSTEAELRAKVDWLLSLTKAEIIKLQKAHREWAVLNHSRKATGERIKSWL